MANTFVKNIWLGNRELIMVKLENEKKHAVLDVDDYLNRVFVGDYGECEEFMYQEFIAYQEERKGWHGWHGYKE